MAGPMDVTFGEDMSPKFHRSYGICPYRQGLLDVPQENLETVDILSDSTTSEDGEFEARRGEQWDDPWNTPGSPATTADMGEFPLKAQQARLSAQVVQDSSATKSLTRNGGDNLQSASKEFLKSTDLYVLLVWWYNIAIGLPSRRFCQQMAVFITSATVVVILEVQSSALQPQSWIFILLENQKGWRPGRWIGEYSVDWIDTTWRTAHSVLHGGAISPVAGLPWVNPARLRALWGACQRRSECTIDAQELAGPSDLYYTLPIRTHPNNQKRRPNNTSSDAPERAKRPRQSAGNGGGPKKDGGEDNNSNNNDDNPPNKNNPNLPKKSNSKGSNPAGLPFACPFFKKCPLKHLRCLFRLQQAARHMKTHLERDHMLSPCCPICFETFETRALHDTHVRGKSCTAPSQPPERDGINEDQWLELGEMPRNSNEDAKWYEMWDILFPGRTRPASPRVDPSDFEGIVVDAVREAREAVFLEGLLELEQQGNLNREQVIGLFRRALVGTNEARNRPREPSANKSPTAGSTAR
uniref:C2H2-type domain-containing protein n=1 Tax=Colletotrichum fructicola (strain Nara gc5) TaxID=1213859 RepID=L2FHX6_COLFN